MFQPLFAAALLLVSAQSAHSTSQLAVFHTPGIEWPEDGLSRTDPIVKKHGMYWGAQDEVEMGGPFNGRSGGMMLLKPGTTLEKAKKIAAEDPAVKAGVMNAEIREWELKVEREERKPSSKKTFPKEVSALFGRIQACAHWGGEEPYDSERDAQIEKAVRELRCDKLEKDKKKILKKYRDRAKDIRAQIEEAEKG